MRRLSFVPIFALLSLRDALISASSPASSNRHSFSLTTFDPSGKLFQVDHAVEAAALGAPILALVLEDKVILAAPQNLPSPLMIDDGTPRFTRLSPSIVMAYTSLSGDGRRVSMEAQRMVLNYQYTFDEEIPIETLLQQLSLLFQSYTMKPGRRPFGCTIVIGCVPSAVGDLERSPQLFRLDPSGSISACANATVVNWKGDADTDQLRRELGDFKGDDAAQRVLLSKWFNDALAREASKKGETQTAQRRILLASTSCNGDFVQECQVMGREEVEKES